MKAQMQIPMHASLRRAYRFSSGWWCDCNLKYESGTIGQKSHCTATSKYCIIIRRRHLEQGAEVSRKKDETYAEAADKILEFTLLEKNLF